VANGVLFLTGPENEVVALDLATGGALWTYRRTVPAGVMLCCGRPNRGVALFGDRVFHGTRT
jgi:alcohol dehydrogenase (cytochrome c)